MIMRVPKNELESRMSRFRQEMDKSYPDWQLTVIFSKVNQYYFTGTMQDGMLFIHRDKKAMIGICFCHNQSNTSKIDRQEHQKI